MRNYFLILLGLFSSFLSKSQLVSDSLLIDGHYRSFHYQQPNGIKNGASLLFALHGSGGNGKGVVNGTKKLAQKASQENVLLVYPDGCKNYWNECRKAATSAANVENINEEAFFAALIDYFKNKHAINEKQVFAVGTSGGGHMCYKLALTMPDRIRAITAIIANLPTPDNLDCTEGKIAVPVLIINGTSDEVNPYEGGVVQVDTGVYLGKVRSTDQTLQYWATLAGYQQKPKKELLPDTDPQDGKTIERYTYQQKGKPEVVLLKVISGKHDYPNDIDVYEEAWAFFKRQIAAIR
jgi:polyhydroxybutyrate depolymerase